MEKSHIMDDFYVVWWSLHFILERERRSHWNILNGGNECPSDDSVEHLRLGGGKIKIKEISGGYCDNLGERRQKKMWIIALERWEQI